MLNTFRNRTTRHDWGEWARRVRVFVNNPNTNGTLHSNWDVWGANNPLNCATVNNDVANTPNNQFIHYVQ